MSIEKSFWLNWCSQFTLSQWQFHQLAIAKFVKYFGIFNETYQSIDFLTKFHFLLPSWSNLVYALIVGICSLGFSWRCTCASLPNITPWYQWRAKLHDSLQLWFWAACIEWGADEGADLPRGCCFQPRVWAANVMNESSLLLEFWPCELWYLSISWLLYSSVKPVWYFQHLIVGQFGYSKIVVVWVR